MTTTESRSNLSYDGVVYEQQALAPEWYETLKEEGYVAYSATSGQNPYNEWYVAKDAYAMREWIMANFNIDKLREEYADINGHWYEIDDVRLKPEGSWSGENEEFEPVHGAEPVTIDELVWAESKF